MHPKRANRVEHGQHHHANVGENRGPHIRDTQRAKREAGELDDQREHDILINDANALTGNSDGLRNLHRIVVHQHDVRRLDGRIRTHRAHRNADIRAAQPIVEEFERRTGVWVQVVSGGTTELLERIAAEAETPVADVMFGGGVESLLAYEDYFMPCDAPRDAMLAECRFENHRFVAFSRLPLAIIYNPRLVSRPPAGFADLLDDGLRGQIAFANPAVSGSSFTVLATLMQALDDENALVRFADNVRGHELSGSGAVVSTVAAGEMRVGVALYETAKKRMLAGEHIAVIWPKEGTSAVPDGAAVLAGCAHEENAQAFISFILSEDVQRRVETEYARESVLTALNKSDGAPMFELCAYDIDWAAANQKDILVRWQALMEGEAP